MAVYMIRAKYEYRKCFSTVDRFSRVSQTEHSRIPAIDGSLDYQASIFRVALRKAEMESL